MNKIYIDKENKRLYDYGGTIVDGQQLTLYGCWIVKNPVKLANHTRWDIVKKPNGLNILEEAYARGLQK